MNKKILILSFFITILISGCGYKIVNYSENINFKINEISSKGEKRINYKIKNKLLSISNDKSTNLITLKISSNKEKNVKERNLKNEITKYKIDIKVEVEFYELSKNISKKFNVNGSGDYNVNKQHSQTISNEKSLIETLSDDLTERIINQLISRMNAN